jgi:hypothetical protein
LGLSSIWWVVLLVGFSGLAIAVLAWYRHARKQRRLEHARHWREHKDWVERSSRQDP